MTAARAELPDAVVKRVAIAIAKRRAVGNPADYERPPSDAIVQGWAEAMWRDYEPQADGALAEFLAIIEERGLRIVPASPLFRMTDSCCTLGRLAEHNGVRRGSDSCRACASDVWETMLEHVPPLAELLEDRDAG